MTKVLSARNKAILENRGKLLVGYLVAGYPDPESFLSILKGCTDAGLDIFEIGFPSTVPFLDGEIIQQAHQAVDRSISTDIEYWKKYRKTIENPIWIMGYKDDLMKGNFYRQLAENGLVDNFVIPDMLEEDRRIMAEELKSYDVNVMAFVNPDMTNQEIEKCLSDEDLIYQQLYAGPTGMTVVEDHFEEILSRAKKHPDVRIFAGFGINTPKRVKQLLASGFDGAVIGTAMVKKLNESPQALFNFIRSVKREISEGMAER
jgi:tryptophan synthase alpha chain